MNLDRVRQRKMFFEPAESGHLFDDSLRFNMRSVKYPGAASANVSVLYTRTALPIVTVAGVVDAWVYIANEAPVTAGLALARWYLNHLLAGREYLSVSYFNSLSQTNCLHDSDIEPV